MSDNLPLLRDFLKKFTEKGAYVDPRTGKDAKRCILNIEWPSGMRIRVLDIAGVKVRYSLVQWRYGEQERSLTNFEHWNARDESSLRVSAIHLDGRRDAQITIKVE